MPNQPIPLRKVPLIAKWTPEILAHLLSDRFVDDAYLITAYEWVENQPARLVSPSTMREALRELNTESSEHAKIARLPAHYFVWSDELETAYETYHSYVSMPEELDAHDAFDLNPATHPFNDLLLECPDFTSNPCLTGGTPLSRMDIRRQETQHGRPAGKPEQKYSIERARGILNPG